MGGLPRSRNNAAPVDAQSSTMTRKRSVSAICAVEILLDSAGDMQFVGGEDTCTASFPEAKTRVLSIYQRVEAWGCGVVSLLEAKMYEVAYLGRVHIIVERSSWLRSTVQIVNHLAAGRWSPSPLPNKKNAPRKKLGRKSFSTSVFDFPNHAMISTNFELRSRDVKSIVTSRRTLPKQPPPIIHENY